MKELLRNMLVENCLNGITNQTFSSTKEGNHMQQGENSYSISKLRKVFFEIQKWTS